MNLVDWNNGMEWNGEVEYWTGLLECHTHYIGNLSIMCLVSFPDPILTKGKGLVYAYIKRFPVPTSEFCCTNQIHVMWLTCDYHVTLPYIACM